MSHRIPQPRRTLFAVALLGVSLMAATPREGATAADEPVRVTQADIDEANAKVAMAYGALIDLWSPAFEAAGGRFDVPDIARYRGPVRTQCGVMPENNAVYCPRANAIYFDEVFLAAQARRTGRALGTDGDMAAIGIIAHEMGHAVAIQLGLFSRYSYPNEMIADCLAGVFARQSERDGHLQDGDLEEAFHGMASAGDPTPELTGNPRIDRRIRSRAALMGHGTREQRMANFDAGLRGGTRACAERFENFR
jgi:uncharacterized protein